MSFEKRTSQEISRKPEYVPLHDNLFNRKNERESVESFDRDLAQEFKQIETQAYEKHLLPEPPESIDKKVARPKYIWNFRISKDGRVFATLYYVEADKHFAGKEPLLQPGHLIEVGRVKEPIREYFSFKAMHLLYDVLGVSSFNGSQGIEREFKRTRRIGYASKVQEFYKKLLESL